MQKPPSPTLSSLLVFAARLHRLRSAQLLSSLGLFPGQERLLQLLHENGVMAMGELAERLRVRPPTASKTVARLAAQGFIERIASDGDGRVVRVSLSALGRETAARIGPLSDKLEQELIADFEPKERKRLKKLLRKAGHNLANSTGTSLAELSESDLDDADDLALDDNRSGTGPSSTS